MREGEREGLRGGRGRKGNENKEEMNRGEREETERKAEWRKGPTLYRNLIG